MIDEFYQSEEKYKGFVLKMRRFRLNDKMIYHRSCDIFKNDSRVGISKTKKEAKKLISEGYMK